MGKAKKEPDYKTYLAQAARIEEHMWNVVPGDPEDLKELKVTLRFPEDAGYLERKLNREKRIGKVEPLGSGRFLFSLRTYDLTAVRPFLRNYIGYIERIETDDRDFLDDWQKNLQAFQEMYGLHAEAEK